MLIGFAAVFASPVAAEVATLDILLDVDQDWSTGCDLMTVDGLVQGVEMRIRTLYDVGTQNVSSTTYADCLDPVDLHPNTAAELHAIISALQAVGATFVDLDAPLLFPLLNASIVAPEPPACCEGIVSQ